MRIGLGGEVTDQIYFATFKTALPVKLQKELDRAGSKDVKPALELLKVLDRRYDEQFPGGEWFKNDEGEEGMDLENLPREPREFRGECFRCHKIGHRAYQCSERSERRDYEKRK